MMILECLDTSFIHLESIFKIVIFFKKKGIIQDDLNQRYPEIHVRKCTKKTSVLFESTFLESISQWSS